jgi:hypothetical protein
MARRLIKVKAQNGTNTLVSKATLTRLTTSNDGTFGKFVCDGFSVYSGELPDRGNLPNISCIPKGVYTCHWTYSPRMKKFTYELENVKGRTSIRIHSANFVGNPSPPFKKQVNGCITLGLQIGIMDGQKAILQSVTAVRQLETLLDKKDFVLEIK